MKRTAQGNQMSFKGPIMEENCRFKILLSMDRYSKWPATSLCKLSEGKIAVKFFQQYIQMIFSPKP